MNYKLSDLEIYIFKFILDVFNWMIKVNLRYMNIFYLYVFLGVINVLIFVFIDLCIFLKRYRLCYVFFFYKLFIFILDYDECVSEFC